MRSSRRDKMADHEDAMRRMMESFTSPHVLRVHLILLVSLAVSNAASPQIVPMKQLDDTKMGQRIVIVCALREGTPPISFSWRKNGVPVMQTGELKVVHNDDYQETLIISKVSPVHVGNYTCSAKNSFGSDQMSLAVAPKFKPIWKSMNGSSLEAQLGQSFTMDCSANGLPSPTVAVYRGSFSLLASQVELSHSLRTAVESQGFGFGFDLI